MIESSNLSHAEYYHLNGKLSAERTEQVLDDLHEAEALDVREYAPYAQEAASGFPSEDCLQEIISDLAYFSKRLRGDNKKELLQIVEALQQTQNELASSSEYGYDCLKKIISTVKKA